jgi:hypothetical protein
MFILTYLLIWVGSPTLESRFLIRFEAQMCVHISLWFHAVQGHTSLYANPPYRETYQIILCFTITSE